MRCARDNKICGERARDLACLDIDFDLGRQVRILKQGFQQVHGIVARWCFFVDIQLLHEKVHTII